MHSPITENKYHIAALLACCIVISM